MHTFKRFGRASVFTILSMLSFAGHSAWAINWCMPATYLQQRPDVAAAGMTAVQHYLLYGQAEGMCRPMWNCTYGEYFAFRPDVLAAGMNPEAHYNAFGKNEGMPAPTLDILVQQARMGVQF